MSSPGGQVRQRTTKDKKRPTTPNPEALGEKVAEKVSNVLEKAKPYKPMQQGSEWDYKIAITVITVLAFITRFWGIRHPDQVVFDEVHFGKFASYYLQRTYFFDVHPPFGKLLFAFAGWLVGYKGEFLFENIGDSYITNKVPYVAYRAMPASLGALTVPIVFLIMWESGYSLPAAVTAAGLMLLDNAHIGQTRLILLVEFIFCIEPMEAESPAIKGHRRTRSRPVRERMATTSQMGSWIATGVILAAVAWSFFFFAPLTYGSPGLDVPQVQARKWLGYDLHFAK